MNKATDRIAVRWAGTEQAECGFNVQAKSQKGQPMSPGCQDGETERGEGPATARKTTRVNAAGERAGSDQRAMPGSFSQDTESNQMAIHR